MPRFEHFVPPEGQVGILMEPIQHDLKVHSETR